MSVRMRRQPPRAHFGKRQHKPLHRVLGGGDFGIGHLREVFSLQHLAVGNGHPRVEFDLAFFLSLSSRPANSASWMRVAPASGGRGALAGACGSIIAIS